MAASNDKSGDFFWVSYSDLMTSLFFVALVLFVLIFGYMQIRLDYTEDQLKKIQELQQAISNIDSRYFEYRPEYKKHVLKVKIAFPLGAADLDSMNSSLVLDSLKVAGKRIISVVDSLNTIRRIGQEEEVKYLVVIEGQASKDRFPDNDGLSYDRALSLRKFWEDQDIDLMDHPDVELIVAGSGVGGVPREPREVDNRRFLIHIIPKIGWSENLE